MSLENPSIVPSSSAPSEALAPYQPRRISQSRRLRIRHLDYHLRVWEPDPTRPCEGDLWMLHGWMDIGASFQFLVDAMAGNRRVYAPDWRGFGLSERPVADSYWFPDYLGDLDALLDQVSGKQAIDLVAHSMGGNVAMLYAGARPERIARLINLEGIGLSNAPPEEAPRRYARWLDELREGARLRDYADLEEVAARLRTTNPRLRADRARWLATHWSRETPQGRREILGDPAHKLVNPVLYRADEAAACWRRIQAPVLMVIGGLSNARLALLDKPEFQARRSALRDLTVSTLADAGHMLHHDQPEALAQMIERFLARASPGVSGAQDTTPASASMPNREAP